MKRSLFVEITLGVIILSFILHENALAWTEKTHENLSVYAAEESVLPDYLSWTLTFENGLQEKFKWDANELYVKDWLAYGANLEDKSDWGFPILPGTTTRSFNHFHNPLKVWAEAGLNDWWTGESSLLWAQDGSNQQNFPEGDWSWKKVREYFYIALTGKDFTGTEVAPDKTARDAYFARTFRGLGQQMHVIQDLAVPDHARNDAHPEDTLGLAMSIGFEKWAGKKFFTLPGLKSFTSDLQYPVLFPSVPLNVSYTDLVPTTQFLDTQPEPSSGTTPSIGVDQGIAEYTNGNFASDDTIFTEDLPSSDGHSFPYPRKTSTNLQSLVSQDLLPVTITAEDGFVDTTIYIKKEIDGEVINHFLKPYYFTRQLIDTLDETHRQYHRWFYRDEKCHEEYAQKLIPRAVGYSAGLLNYFFRGQMDSEIGGYTFDDEYNCTGVFLRLHNFTPNESMGPGKLVVLWGYYGGSALTVSNEVDLTESIPSGFESVNEYYFAFTHPTIIVETDFLLVFRGILGSEVDAVAATMSTGFY